MLADDVLDALGDGTRRAVLGCLRTGPQSVQELADQLPVSRPAVSQHLKVLHDAGLVIVQAAGTKRLYTVRSEGLEPARAFLDSFWGDALARFKAHAESTAPPTPRSHRARHNR